MALASGTKLGPYDLQSLLGAGGMGEVYRARDTRLNRVVAIKVLPATFSADAARLQRFMQEARSAAALNHPNILSILGKIAALLISFPNCWRGRRCANVYAADRFQAARRSTMRCKLRGDWRR